MPLTVTWWLPKILNEQNDFVYPLQPIDFIAINLVRRILRLADESNTKDASIGIRPSANLAQSKPVAPAALHRMSPATYTAAHVCAHPAG